MAFVPSQVCLKLRTLLGLWALSTFSSGQRSFELPGFHTGLLWFAWLVSWVGLDFLAFYFTLYFKNLVAEIQSFKNISF